MIPLSIGEIAALVHGSLVGADPDVMVTGKVEFDSRRVSPGDLFLAIAGERVDGHDFAEAARAAGAVGVLSTRPLPAGSVVVADPLEAITALATAVSPRLPARIIGITGSSGKTSTKDLAAQVFARLGATVAPPGSFNNELGYPYTVLLADADTRYLVLETSARGVGHIAHLTRIARPQLGIVLNVGSAHLGEFGSVEAIAQAKGELVEAVPPAAEGGVAILNADDPRVAAMARRTAGRVVMVGRAPTADFRAEDVVLDPDGRAAFRLATPGESAAVSLRVVGEHQVGNALAVAAAAVSCGMPVSEVADALSAAAPASRWRMEVTRTADGVTVVNDAYNANPESMRAALAASAGMADGRRLVAVLGQMAELGTASEQAHEELGREVARARVQHLLVVGAEAAAIARGAVRAGLEAERAEQVSDVTEAAQRLSSVLEAGDVVLIKGSRAAGMERVAEAVLAGRGVESPGVAR